MSGYRWGRYCGAGITIVAVSGAISCTAEPSQATRAQVGLASYYGPGLDGEPTASGETLDQDEMVAAHRRLPLGTKARVTNLENGRAVVVRIIDRGPYGRNARSGAIIDVSKGAARRLGFVHDGIVRVKVEVLQIGRE